MAYRKTPAYADVDSDSPPVPEGHRVDGCTEVDGESDAPQLPSAAGAATWLRVLVPSGGGGEPLVRFLPTFLGGDVTFAPVLEDGRFKAKAKKGESEYIVPEMQQ